MLELTGMAAIIGVVTGSFLIALFIGETLITWIIRAMDAGVKRAESGCGAGFGTTPKRQVDRRTTRARAESVTFHPGGDVAVSTVRGSGWVYWTNDQ